MTTTTSVSELKAKLSAYLDLVKAGEEVIVTDRGVPVARLGALPADLAHDAHMAELVRTGQVRLPAKPMTREWVEEFLATPGPEDPEGLSLKYLLEERESGW